MSAKLLIIIFATTVVIVSVVAKDIVNQNAQLYIFEQQINETLKNLSSKLAQHDPFFIRKINVNFEHELGHFDFDVEEIRISGFSNFWATNLKISTIPPSMTFDIRFQELHILAPYYNLNAFGLFIPFYGNGFMNLRATVIDLGGSAKVRMGIGGISAIKNVKARFNLEKSNLIISGILHNEPMSQIVSTSTTECFPEFVNTYGERFGQLVGGAIERIVNYALNPSLTENYHMPSHNTETFNVKNGTFKYYYQL